MDLKLGEIRRSFPTERSFANFFRNVIIQKMPRERWTPDKVVEFIQGCREQGGIPFFYTGYSGDFIIDDKPAVRTACWGGVGPEMSKMFTHVPEDIFETMKKRSGDWHFIVIRYRPDLYDKLISMPVKL